MQKIKVWIAASRPKTLIASISPVLIGSSIASYQGYFNLSILLSALLSGVFIQIGTNLANDYFDFKKGADTSKRIGPMRVTQANLVSEVEIKWAIGIVFLSALLTSSILIAHGGAIIALLMCIAILLGVGYTAGPFPLAYLGLGDIFVILGFGLLATGMTTYIMTGSLSAAAFISGLIPGSLSTAILTINNLRDLAQDKKAKKLTLPVRFGELFGKWEYFILLLLPHLIPLILYLFFNFPFRITYTLAAIIPSLPLLIQIHQVKRAGDYIPFLPKTALILTIFTLFFCLGLIL